ncbi:MAG TPA: nucleotidyltransferase domain-containing protein, partial [Actinomycetota bacterium]|nr:nucleotidyltransferase domain-containing protein [Actinomycetota bacterium]
MAPGAEFADVFERLRAALSDLRARHTSGAGGLAVARARAAAMDEALGQLWARVAPPAGSLALVAIGGYGRGELSPASDLDLMVLHAGEPSAREVSERLYYALWDNAGVPVGHATRTVKECLRLAKTNLEAETSFLTPRLLAGAEASAAEFTSATLAATRKRRSGFVRDVREMMRARHVVSGSATSQVEPNLKEGIGGLRDLHVMGWFERVEGANLLSSADHAHLEEAADLLLRVRDDLHDLTGSASDVLLLQHQRPIALRLGYSDAARPAEDELMRGLFTATRGVELIVSSVVADLVAGPPRRIRSAAGGCFAEQDGRVVVARTPDLAAEPERALEAFALGVPPGSGALHALEDALAQVGTLPWTDAVRRAFLG